MVIGLMTCWLFVVSILVPLICKWSCVYSKLEENTMGTNYLMGRVAQQDRALERTHKNLQEILVRVQSNAPPTTK